MADINPGDEVAIKPAPRKEFEKLYGQLPDVFLVDLIDDTRHRKTLVLATTPGLVYASDCTLIRTKEQREQNQKKQVQVECQVCNGIGLAGHKSCPVCQGTGKVWVTEG